MRTIILLLILAVNSCEKKTSLIVFTGLLQKQGMTTYQYGTHTISDGRITCALRSTTIDMSKYEGKNVRIEGVKVEGYPIEGGPDYIEVEKIVLK